jgi:hypothetical protein
MLIVSMSTAITSMQLDNKKVETIEDLKKDYPTIKENYFRLDTIEKSNTNDFGICIHTKYNGQDNSQKLDIDLTTFILMLKSGGWKYYNIDFGSVQATAGVAFSRTQIYVDADNEYVDVVQTQFMFETNGDTTEDYEVSVEVRFPFSSLEDKGKTKGLLETRSARVFDFIKSFFSRYKGLLLPSLLRRLDTRQDNGEEFSAHNQEEYFCARIGFASPEGDEGPRRVETRFFFGRNSIWDPRIFRMKITPYDLGGDYKVSYFNSYLTVSDTGAEAFYRVFSVDFDPAAELQITSIPRQAKIGYAFGSTVGSATKISFLAEGGALSNIVQSFLIDPLPSYMNFDLTILGERKFLYESDRQHSVTYMMDDVQEGELVKVELESLPKRITAEWGLRVALSSWTVSGLIDLDMSSDVGRAAVSLFGSDTPFMEILNFPQHLDVSASLNIQALNGHVTANKASSGTTTINVPIRWDKWEITGTLYINNGYGHASFNLPDSSSDHVSVGLDTNGNSLFGLAVTVVDTSIPKQILHVSVDAVATDDLFVSFDYVGSEIQNFGFSGKITELIDLVVSVDFSGINLDLTGSWTLGEQGKFDLGVNEDIVIDLSQLELGNVKLSGEVGLYEGSSISLEWIRGETGKFWITTNGVGFSPRVELTMTDAGGEIFFTGGIVLDPNCLIKFEWEWGSTGRFMVFTNGIIEEIDIEALYHNQYGFKIDATNFEDFTRTVQWDTDTGGVPRIWFLGDSGFPGDWDVWLLWNYEWYEVK